MLRVIWLDFVYIVKEKLVFLYIALPIISVVVDSIINPWPVVQFRSPTWQGFTVWYVFLIYLFILDLISGFVALSLSRAEHTKITRSDEYSVSRQIILSRNFFLLLSHSVSVTLTGLLFAQAALSAAQYYFAEYVPFVGAGGVLALLVTAVNLFAIASFAQLGAAVDPVPVGVVLFTIILLIFPMNQVVFLFMGPAERVVTLLMIVGLSFLILTVTARMMR